VSASPFAFAVVIAATSSAVLVGANVAAEAGDAATSNADESTRALPWTRALRFLRISSSHSTGEARPAGIDRDATDDLSRFLLGAGIIFPGRRPRNPDESGPPQPESGFPKIR